MDEVHMPTRWETIARTARRLVLGRQDLEMLVAAAMSVGTLLYSLCAVFVRLVLFLAMPVSVLALYPVMRSNHRRWFKWAHDESRSRSALVAELTKECSKPVEWPHQWPRDEQSHPAMIPSADQKEDGNGTA